MVDVLLPVDFFSTGVRLDSRHHLPVLIHEQMSTIWINTNNTMYFMRHQPSANTITADFAFVKASSESKYLHLYKHVVSLGDMVEPGDESNGLVRRARVVERTQLTGGYWCVEWKENVCVDEPNNLIFFVGYRNPLESQLYVVDMRYPMRVKQLTPDNYSHTVNMNKTCTLFVAVSSNLTTPGTVAVYQIVNQKLGLDKLNASEIARILNPDSAQMPVASLSVLHDDAQRTLLTQPEIFSLRTSDNTNMYGLIYRPCNYKPNVKYPTVLHVYGGPRVQLVSNAYKANGYRLHMLSLLGYCVVVVDSRGSDYRGVDFKSHLRHRMGAVGIDDQVQGLVYAANKYECIDMSRMAIFGWSYGGYMSLMGLCQRPDVFKLAIAGAPVTTWELYDTGYTERYMGLPCANTDGYARGNVLNWAKSFPNEENRLLIMHGMIDENVHFIHMRKLISALIRENKPYTLQVYPNERHGVRSKDASMHCDLNLFSFLEQSI
jgi:dipeptidyl-peptidase 9